MKVIITKIFILLSFFNYANCADIDDAFITTYEYGQMLYNNPRGIGCNKCHGEDAKGMFLSRYTTKKDKEVVVSAPDITNVSFEVFLKKLSTQNIKRSLIMPTYFLTNNELKSLYMYITSKNKKEENK
jgi:hypothetical protein